MQTSEALLCLGIAILVLWLLLSITYPWVGFAVGAVVFIVLISFMFFMLTCYVVSRRPRVG